MDWSWDDDVRVFRGWAIYTGKYQPREDVTADADLELAKKWKTNFRCALNVLPGLEMIKEESNARGANAKKVYIMKPDKKSKKRRKQKVLLPTFIERAVYNAARVVSSAGNSLFGDGRSKRSEKPIQILVKA
ncbi:hypothetical protein QZH41_004819 [Actinostola sp. cb2023]|nr:hypothetical protein QZH41_004819 [Actinostola sp. cb2023]